MLTVVDGKGAKYTLDNAGTIAMLLNAGGDVLRGDGSFALKVKQAGVPGTAPAAWIIDGVPLAQQAYRVTALPTVNPLMPPAYVKPFKFVHAGTGEIQMLNDFQFSKVDPNEMLNLLQQGYEFIGPDGQTPRTIRTLGPGPANVTADGIPLTQLSAGPASGVTTQNPATGTVVTTTPGGTVVTATSTNPITGTVMTTATATPEGGGVVDRSGRPYRLVLVSAPGRIDSGATYPGCSRANPDACRPGQFPTIQAAWDYAAAHGETPLLVGSPDEAWDIAEGRKAPGFWAGLSTAGKLGVVALAAVLLKKVGRRS